MPDHTDVVAAVKADLIARGVNLTGPCGAFEITKRVLWQLRAEGWGYLAAPPGGENCNGFRTDKGVTRSGRFVDCLIDAGGANTPAWQERAATADEVAAFRPLADPGDVLTPPPAPVPAPVPSPAPVPEPDLLAFAQEFFGELEKIAQGLTDVCTALGDVSKRLDAGVKLRL